MAVIGSFGDSATADLFNGVKSAKARRFTAIVEAAIDKLTIIAYALTLEDLSQPPGNHLEKLVGNLAGWHSIRINRQWRIIFKWKGAYAFEVQIVDYH